MSSSCWHCSDSLFILFVKRSLYLSWGRSAQKTTSRPTTSPEGLMRMLPRNPSQSMAYMTWNTRLFTERLKSDLLSCGLEPSLYIGHSFRRGDYLLSENNSTSQLRKIYARVQAKGIKFLPLSKKLMLNLIKGLNSNWPKFNISAISIN